MLIALGAFFAITSLDAAGACYVVPCVTGDVASLYRVSTGASFQALLSCMLFVATPAYGLTLLRVRCSETAGGAYMAACAASALLALLNAAVWGSERATMVDLEVYEETGHNVTANEVGARSLGPLHVARATASAAAAAAPRSDAWRGCWRSAGRGG